MNSERDFSKTSTSISYTGRKIRMVNPIEEESAQVITRNKPKAKLVRSIERNINLDTENHLIAVFGIDSDNVLKEALREISQNNHVRDFILLPKSYLIGNAFQTFAGMMLGYMQGERSKKDWRLQKLASDPYVKKQVINYLLDICPNEAHYNNLSDLSNVVRIAERPNKCKELLEFIRRNCQGNEFKFIWNIEICPTDFDKDLLNNLSQIVCENMIIVVNFLRPLDMEAQLMGSAFGDVGSSVLGRQLMQKYLRHEDIITTD